MASSPDTGSVSTPITITGESESPGYATYRPAKSPGRGGSGGRIGREERYLRKAGTSNSSVGTMYVRVLRFVLNSVTTPSLRDGLKQMKPE